MNCGAWWRGRLGKWEKNKEKAGLSGRFEKDERWSDGLTWEGRIVWERMGKEGIKEGWVKGCGEASLSGRLNEMRITEELGNVVRQVK